MKEQLRQKNNRYNSPLCWALLTGAYVCRILQSGGDNCVGRFVRGSSRVAMAFLFQAVAEALGIALNAAISGPISEVVQRGTGLLAAGGRLVPC
jgi:hypothetical protein